RSATSSQSGNGTRKRRSATVARRTSTARRTVSAPRRRRLFAGRSRNSSPASENLMLGPGRHLLEIDLNGVIRSAQVYVPAALADRKRAPVVMMFHGAGATARWAIHE